MGLRALAMSGGGLATVLLLPIALACLALDHVDVARGLLVGLGIGLLNSLMLARKLDRVIAGRDPWQNLGRTMPRNMLVRFGLIFALSSISITLPGVHVAGLVGGVTLYLVASLAYVSWAVWQRWREEDGNPVYG